jgi:adenosine deaminase
MHTAPAQDSLQSLPKVMLHEHLDGGLRPQTLLDLCRAKGIALPADDALSVARWIQGNANSGSLERYVAAFAPTVATMSDAAACERVAFEAAQDALQDGCVLAEFRMAPTLLEPHGLRAEAAIEALLAGLRRSALPSGLIVCAMRTDSSLTIERSARLAAHYANAGVVGFDIAGAERGYPATAHAKAIDIARDAGLGITLHAGEADEGARVLEAIALGATRIGHGVQIAVGQGATQRMQALRDTPGSSPAASHRNGVHFEVCPTSNVHTGAVASLATHPLRAMWQAGLNLSVQTDNRLMSGITLTQELETVRTLFGFSLNDLALMSVNAAHASFMPQTQRDAAVQAVQAWCIAQGL